MDRETTIEYMRKAVACHNENLTDCLGRNCCDCSHDYHVDTIELIESALELLEQDRWIPCNVRPPENKKKVLVSYDTEDGKKVDISMFDKYGCLLGLVSAWRPLPAPYQEDEA